MRDSVIRWPVATDAVTPAKYDPETTRMIADVPGDINVPEIAFVMHGLGADNRLRDANQRDRIHTLGHREA